MQHKQFCTHLLLTLQSGEEAAATYDTRNIYNPSVVISKIINKNKK